MDFMYDQKLTQEQKEAVEKQVNAWIGEGLDVVHRTLLKDDAQKLGAQMEFGAKYPDEVSVYSIGSLEVPVSIEFCGGPHIENLSELGEFKIKKESSSSKGVRRIKAVLLEK
jgi:alanyl-tRNA synthetase